MKEIQFAEISLRDQHKWGDDSNAQLLAEHGALIDGIPLNKYFEIELVARKLCYAYKEHLETNYPAMTVVNIGGEDHNLCDYGLENTFSDTELTSKRNIELIAVCIHKKITRKHILLEMQKRGICAANKK